MQAAQVRARLRPEPEQGRAACQERGRHRPVSVHLVRSHREEVAQSEGVRFADGVPDVGRLHRGRQPGVFRRVQVAR